MQRPTLARIEDPSRDDVRHRWESAAGAGFDGVELVIPESPPDGFDADLNRLVAACALDCPVRAISLGGRSTDPNAAKAEIERWLRGASDLGATCLNLSLSPIAAEGGGFGGYSEAINFMHALLRQLRGTAEATGVAIALEVGGGALVSPIEVRELIDTANTWAIGACVDTTRLAPGGSPIDWLRTLHRRVTAVRVASATSGAIAAVLDEIRYEGPVIVHDTTSG